MDLADVMAELYGLDPAGFVAARTARVRDANAAGDRELAKEIAALRKPTLVGWAVNIAARELPDELHALLELGEALRIAQQTLSGGELRRLTAQRQQTVRAFVRKAGELAALRGHPLNEGALREVSQTLHAALADPIVAQQVSPGTLISAVSYSGFGIAGLAAVPDDPGGTAKTSGPEPVSPSGRQSEQAGTYSVISQPEQQLAEAQQKADAAQIMVEQARAAVAAARSQLAAADAELARLREQLDHAAQTRQFVHNAEEAAAGQLRAAEEAASRAQRALVQLSQG